MDNFEEIKESNDKYLKLKDLSVYSGISIRRLRDFIKDPEHSLPCFRMEGMILVRRCEFDSWMEQHFRLRKRDLEQIVDEVVNGF